jgi:hypothetical protein
MRFLNELKLNLRQKRGLKPTVNQWNDYYITLYFEMFTNYKQNPIFIKRWH